MTKFLRLLGRYPSVNPLRTLKHDFPPALVFVAIHGLATFIGNQLAERAQLLLTQAALRPRYSFLGRVPYEVVVRVTLLQLALVALIFYTAELSPELIRASFPVLIVLLVPLRRYVLPSSACCSPFSFEEEDLAR